MLKLAIIGDVHGYWNQKDIDYFNQSDYNHIIFVGDLPPHSSTTVRIAKRIAKLTVGSSMLPGNHDTTNLFQLVGEVFQNQFLIRKGSFRHLERINALQIALGNVQLRQYEVEELNDLSLIYTRPLSMGGPMLSFLPYLDKMFAIRSIKDSAKKINSLINASKSKNIVFIAHNGPYGLGKEQNSIWGRDFDKRGGDWGDRDLLMAINYAKKQNKNVQAVIAGHMHYNQQKGSYTRNWFLKQENTNYINAARVPRIFKHNEQKVHHHIRLTWQAQENTMQASCVFVDNQGKEIIEELTQPNP
ncbi:MAG: metallophosphoesterase [Spirochaetota bacterium]